MIQGASLEEWLHFDLMLGLTQDLMPAVADPAAPIHPKSKLKKLGKVPSRYVGGGFVIGFRGWNQMEITNGHVERWSQDRRYNILVRARRIACIDVDVENAVAARSILGLAVDVLGVLPMRIRTGSHRYALGFVCAGEFGGKRVVTLPEDQGVIEFLTDGQQWVIAGRHPDGDRYGWRAGLPGGFPSVPVASVLEFEERLKSVFHGVSHVDRRTRRSGAQTGSHSDSSENGAGIAGAGHKLVVDPIGDYLSGSGWVLEESGRDDGGLYIECPWTGAHTGGERGDGSTIWFPPGNGYDQGHFKCLHAHCTGRGDAEFLEAVGYVAAQFAVVPAGGESEGGSDGLGGGGSDGLGGGGLGEEDEPTAVWTTGGPGVSLLRSKRGFLATQDNVVKALRTRGWWAEVGFDTFRNQLMLQPWKRTNGAEWRGWVDTDYTRARIALERAGFAPVPTEMIRAGVWLVGEENKFNSAQVWLRELPEWDGVSRLGEVMTRYYGCLPGDYASALGRYLFTAIVGRIMEPGCQVDIVPVLVGDQGVGKSRSVEALVPWSDLFVSLDLNHREDDLYRSMQGRLVGELNELRGLEGRDRAALNAFITQRQDTWTPKYREFSESRPRGIVLVGTSNDAAFIGDETGARRWAPVLVCEVPTAAGEGKVDVEGLRGVLNMLYAEALVTWMADGVRWFQAESLAREVHGDFMAEFVWAAECVDWLNQKKPSGLDENGCAIYENEKTIFWKDEDFTTNDFLDFGLRMPVERRTGSVVKTVAKALKSLGYKSVVSKGKNRKSFRVWRI